MSRYLVTGGAGFIGSNIVRRLLELGHGVSVVDDLSSGRAGNLEELEGRFRFIEGSVNDFDLMANACEGVDYVLHQAAVPSVQRSIEDPTRTGLVNAQGTLVTLDSARVLYPLSIRGSQDISGGMPASFKRAVIMGRYFPERRYDSMKKFFS